MSIVIALGGNALMNRGISFESQMANAQKSMKSISHLLKGKCVLTHGNGPQVGNILLKDAAKLKDTYPVPLSAAVAETEGEIGFVLEQALHSVKPVVTVLTRVLVNPKDPAFSFPSKPIGPWYTERSAMKLSRQFDMKKTAKGWRRVVPSPQPLKILESGVIRNLLSTGVLPIAAGGGGIPVVKNGSRYVGIDAVIDKDSASAVLASGISASELHILTDVPYVYLNYRTKNQTALKILHTEEALKLAKQGHFGEGSMLPKIEAAVHFVSSGGRRAIITDLSAKKGTVITK